MIKTFYILAWFLLVGAVLASVLIGTFNGLAMVALSLIALGLFRALALLPVLVQMGEVQSHSNS